VCLADIQVLFAKTDGGDLSIDLQRKKAQLRDIR
jgi:hypothetical protein